MIRKKKLITLTALFFGATLAFSAATVEAQEIPGCRSAWNDLAARNALEEAHALIAIDCPIMYREGWLVNPNKLGQDVVPGCVTAWNTLANRGALASTRFLVMHNCPVIYRKRWR